MIDLLRTNQVWKKVEMKEEVDKSMGTEVSETQFAKILKELCRPKAKKWYLKYFDA